MKTKRVIEPGSNDLVFDLYGGEHADREDLCRYGSAWKVGSLATRLAFTESQLETDAHAWATAHKGDEP